MFTTKIKPFEPFSLHYCARLQRRGPASGNSSAHRRVHVGDGLGFSRNSGGGRWFAGRHVPGSEFECGVKLFRKDVARDVFSRQLLERFGFDVEVLFITRRRGYWVAEVPVRWNHAEGSKVGMFTGLHAFVELAQVRMNDWRGRYS